MRKIRKLSTFLLMIIFLCSAINSIALAQNKTMEFKGKCYVNGKEVPCEEVGRQVKKFFGFGILLFILGILSFIFWIFMLVHAATQPIENKAMWIIIVVLAGIFGAIVYYFTVKRRL